MSTAYTILNIPLWFTLVPENLLRYPTLALDVSLRMLEEQVSFEPNEIILGDKGYQGHPRVLSAIKNTSSYRVDYCDKAFNEVLDSVRQLVECTFKAKRFWCSRLCW